MSSGCGDVLSLQDLKTAKLHQTFEAEVITGRAGGVASGASIDYATNQVTGQTQKTMPAILRDLGFRPAAFNFTTGGTLAVGDSDVGVLWPVADGGDGDYYVWKGALPKTIPANSTPASAGGVSVSGWMPVGDLTLRKQLADTTNTGGGAVLIGVKQSGLGAVARTQHQKNSDIVSVKDFGAVGDGVTDDSAAIQAAHDSLPAGGCIYFPGTHFWRVETPIQLSKGVTIMGSGFNQTTLIKTSNPDCAFFNVKEEGTTLRDFRMIGLGSSAVTANTYAVTVNTTARRFMAINVHMLNVACGFKLLGNLFTIRDCEIRDIKAGTGVGIQVDQSGVVDGVGLITGTIMQNGNQPYAGIHFVHAVGLLISDCQIMGMNLAMCMTPSSGKYVVSIKVVNVYFDGPTNGGLWIETSGTGYVSRITVGDSWLSSSTIGAGVRVVENSVVYGLRISDCEIYDNVNGILIDGGGTMQALAIANCVFSGQDTADVTIGANVSGFTVTGCRFGAAGAFSASPTGLYINPGCSEFVVTGNWLHNFTDAGSTTGVVIDANRGSMFGAAPYNPPSLPSGAGVTTTVECLGAKPGDIAGVSYSGDLQGIVLTASIGAANQVVVRFQNGVGTTIDLPEGILRVSASRYT